ncbi:MAG: hypothetical protein KJ060_18610 [Candidatus Hydrogenedentes bacterium]|nr:hypothetical protein [Candidatus Hydrogenedentota bacterium]
MSWWIWSKRTNHRGWWLTSVDVSGFLSIGLILLALFLTMVVVPLMVR